ncbi:hypothetical protein FF38_00558 [Lucilia cuprina]|uniref:Uncharacterized protein n=1 Tax=Lucilia cuprina TaxID=7375 RepID=A0A0L0CL13_LUCCU|nr:hypothetical protein FF38_00558 [Lucilia cuprina]
MLFVTGTAKFIRLLAVFREMVEPEISIALGGRNVVAYCNLKIAIRNFSRNLILFESNLFIVGTFHTIQTPCHTEATNYTHPSCNYSSEGSVEISKIIAISDIKCSKIFAIPRVRRMPFDS